MIFDCRLLVTCGTSGLACFNGGTCNANTSTCTCLAGFGGADCQAGRAVGCILATLGNCLCLQLDVLDIRRCFAITEDVLRPTVMQTPSVLVRIRTRVLIVRK